MKTIPTYAKWLLGIVLFILAVACSKKDIPFGNFTPSVVEYSATDTSLSLFHAAIEQVNLAADSTYQNAGPFTVFAPNNSAMTKAGFTLSVIKSLNSKQQKDSLLGIVKYLFAKGNINSTVIVGFSTLRATSIYPKTGIYDWITKNYKGFFINGVKVIKADIPTGNGILHIVEGLPLVPTLNMYQTIKANSKLKDFAAVLIDSIQVLHDETLYDTTTIIAPSDSGFRAIGYKNVGELIRLKDHPSVGYGSGLDSILGYFTIYNNGAAGFNGTQLTPFHNGLNGLNYHYTPEFYGVPSQTNPISGFIYTYDSTYGYHQTFNTVHFIFNTDGITSQNGERIIVPNISTTNGVLHISDKAFASY